MLRMPLEYERLRDSMAAVCRQYGVRRLDAFGSSVRADFDRQRSDADFLVEFFRQFSRRAADRYFGLRDSLQALLGRPVDLVMERAVRNPYFLRAIANERRNVYVA